MLTIFTDDDVRNELRSLIERSSYRSVASQIGIDHAYLYRIATGAKDVTEQVALAVGFVPEPRKWTRK